MSIVNFGSLNIDDVYRVHHIVRPGETISARSYQIFPGGKGCNQSVALGRAGVTARHVGKVGHDGKFLVDLLAKSGVDTTDIRVSEGPTGRAIIQVDDTGQNSIVLFPGANQEWTEAEVLAALDHCAEGDWILAQNEVSCMPFLLEQASQRRIPVALNPAPMGPEVLDYPLDAVRWLIVNETEAEALAGASGSPLFLAERLQKRVPASEVILTLGGDGVLCVGPEHSELRIPAIQVPVTDTTAAGDTFLGFALAELHQGTPLADALEWANRAAALTVTRSGAASSIPTKAEVISWTKSPHGYSSSDSFGQK